jgi:outer membrane receptor for ferrienterochelin and colicins
MNHLLYKSFFIIIFIIISKLCYAQTFSIKGKVVSEGKALQNVSLNLEGTQAHTLTDSLGFYQFVDIKAGKYKMQTIIIGYKSISKTLILKDNESLELNFDLTNFQNNLNEVVVTGTLKEVNRLESPVPVEVYTATFFKKNPTANIYEALQNVNGVRPQLNCNICNTGDIHINGLEGPYTMILIDGMPIVSSLSTVYGLSGIPNSLVERIEIVKGPASSLYGSEAVGGLVNIITKKAQSAPVFSADVFATGYGEYNTDLGFKLNVSKNISVLTGINYFKYGNVIDNNKDNFTDVTLQDRISIFQKWNIERKQNRLLSIAGRFNYEDRWGGETQWTKKFRGGDQIYGESIYTNRWELIGNYQLPVKEKLFLSFSFNNHDQDSRYGTTSYIANQKVGFSQLTWDKKIKNHDLLFGAALRYTFYDDNTPATFSINSQNQPQNTWLPGFFIQDELKIVNKHSFLVGFRYDFNSIHGGIYTPRFAYKWSLNENNIIRFNAGTGFRVVNLFTEDHAALTGAREVIIANELNPEKTYNVNLNYLKKMYSKNGAFFGIDISAFYTYFNNRIIGDFDTNPNQIIYNNLNGYAISQGFTGNFDVSLVNGLKIMAGFTYQDVATVQNKQKEQQILTEKFSATWSVSYKINKLHLGIDYTGSLYSPMRLPLISDKDPRSAFSPTWSLQNIQFTYHGLKRIEIYSGVKNLLNFTPNRNTSFIIARADDPFDKNVQFDANGQVVVTPDNPYQLTFDPNYVYAPNQNRRLFLGIRYQIK